VRLRVVVPRAGRGRGQRSLRSLRAALLCGVVAVVAGCGSAERPEPPEPAPAPPRLAIGLAEQNPHLIAPGPVPEGFGPWRDRTVALRPQVFRLLVDWSQVQPAPGATPDLAALRDGCLRGRPPCAPYAGVRDLLRALAARRRADGGWAVVMSVYGAPQWALEPVAGCPDGGRIRLDAYRAFLRALADAAREAGVEVVRWSPWNEPNHPVFLAPQRPACDREAPSRSPAAYAELVRATREALGPRTPLLLGEVAGYDRPRRDATGAAEFAAALPRDVACAGDVWAQHAYVGRGTSELAADREAGGHAKLLEAVTAALDAHGCERRHRLWITETGATPSERACTGMDAALRAWEADPRVDVAIQYTFRQDTEFPVGLADARLTELKPSYAAWRAWGGTRDPADPPPPDPCGT
jgi:hypothetical protein